MPPIPLVLRARAKVNLHLNITGRRADGFHELDSLFAFSDLADLIVIKPGDALTFDPPAGPFGGAVEPDGDNLVMRAAAVLRREAGVTAGARISLDKHIPVAAGLGGGSADAAATLAGLNMLWGLRWPVERLAVSAAQLGADVPACLWTTPVYARGIGEQVSHAPPLPRCGLLLVNPRAPTPTPAVFKAFTALNPEIVPRRLAPPPERFPALDDLAAFLASRGNDLLAAAVGVTPAIADVLAALRHLDAIAYAGLSGSGATCFALLPSKAAAATAGRELARRHAGWWTHAGALGG